MAAHRQYCLWFCFAVLGFTWQQTKVNNHHRGGKAACRVTKTTEWNSGMLLEPTYEQKNGPGSFTVTWLSLLPLILLKKIQDRCLNDPIMHLISTGSNIFHDDNAPLHEAWVVTEHSEWHYNDISRMTSVNRYDSVVLSLYIEEESWCIDIHHLGIEEAWHGRHHDVINVVFFVWKSLFKGLWNKLLAASLAPLIYLIQQKPWSLPQAPDHTRQNYKEHYCCPMTNPSQAKYITVISVSLVSLVGDISRLRLHAEQRSIQKFSNEIVGESFSCF